MAAALTFDEKYAVLGAAGAAYEGQFITAVKTTGVFCRPACRARKPNRENVTFFETPQEALRHGYRPCKLCRPMDPLGAAPPEVQRLMDDLAADPFRRFKDQDLRDRGVDPARIRRWFKRHHGMTFQGYQRLLRLNAAYRGLRQGERVTDTAFDSGYRSLSGFNDSYKSIFGAPPSASAGRAVLTVHRFPTPLGPMIACASEAGLCLLDFTDRRRLETGFAELRKRLVAVILPGDGPILAQTRAELAAYFAGTLRKFTVPLHLPGSDFQQAVWAELQRIPYGATRSYKDQAIALNRPTAIRAVAAANGQNRVAIIVPCHRVIGADGSMVGYGGGIARKRALLDLEAGPQFR
ncbi:MAG: bifunctional transcriptional activator/DNA repair enzyme AdaA [Magnetospiraceae bacterium]